MAISLLALVQGNAEKYHDACVTVPLEDVLKGPGYVATKIIERAAQNKDDAVKFNVEQVPVIALMVCPLEKAWR